MSKYSAIYKMTSNSLFPSVPSFSTGFRSPFVVSSGRIVLGTLMPGQSLAFPDGGVSEFTISQINPLADQTSFPLKLEFSTPAASFTEDATSGP
jgi:hypothetical protein